MISIEKTENYRQKIKSCLDRLIEIIGPIQIGNPSQFPYGWRKAAKGRTVWRILEETINQNMEINYKSLGLDFMEPSPSEVSVYDASLGFPGDDNIVYLNIKTSVAGGRTNKDDISKAAKLYEFYIEDVQKQLFIATYVLDFKDDMKINLNECHVMPIAWLPDIYVNPSNNGNLQSSKYKDITTATKRTSPDFFRALVAEMEVARKKREAKAGRR